MKNLKKLAVMGAVFASTNFAGAKEVDFTPMGKPENIDSIELMNSHIMVKPTENDRVPYYFVGTNTDHFAERGFANADMTNLTSSANSKTHVYATRASEEDTLLKYTVLDKDAIEGVQPTVERLSAKGIKKIISAEEDNLIGTNKDNALVNYLDGSTNTTDTLVFQNGDDSYVAYNDPNTIYVRKNNNHTVHSIPYYASESVAKSLVAFGDKQVYVLTKKGDLFTNNRSYPHFESFNIPVASNVVSITSTKNSKNILISQKDGTVSSYNSETNKTSDITNPKSKEFTANGIRYYAIGKKLGWERN